MFLEALLAFVPAFGLKKEETKKKSEDIWSLDSFIQWIETKNPVVGYNYSDPSACLIAQYLTEKGLKKVGVTNASVRWGGTWSNNTRKLPPHWNCIALHGWTFGGALRDARRYRANYQEAA